MDMDLHYKFGIKFIESKPNSNNTPKQNFKVICTLNEEMAKELELNWVIFHWSVLKTARW